MKLYERANQILAAREAEKAAEEKAHQEELNTTRKELLAEFETEFADFLPMLVEAGINYGANLNDPNYKHKGSYIYFENDRHFLKMDFSSGKSYRFYHEENPSFTYQEIAAFGEWLQQEDKFILFIAENFPLESESGSPLRVIGEDETFPISKAA